MWIIYLLYNARHNKTYIGITTNLERRIRQHNGFIKGGAKATACWAPGWRCYCLLRGLKTRSEAQRWEKILKGRHKGLNRRQQAFYDLEKGLCPPGKYYEPPKNIIYEEY